jgi:hypothetical protein
MYFVLSLNNIVWLCRYNYTIFFNISCHNKDDYYYVMMNYDPPHTQ